MAFHSIDAVGFFEAVTPEALRWMCDAAQAGGMEIGTIPLGDPTDEGVAGVSILRLPAGGVLPRHTHSCHRVEVILQGSMDVGDGRPLGPGTVMISPPGEAYGPHVAGPEGVTTVEVFSAIYAPTSFDLEATPELSEAVAQAQRSLRSSPQGQG